ncbi:type IV secretion system DNA-binding domain-containing protein [Tunturibacter empetritectus]|uniref:Type IV secretory pathway TraG/TraD family ATPase VirD4 n=1 Tax=Tunturiibacter lichenicola TaxID=2051959 RepID=A0A7W8JC14_9BACT|nr:type IV secretion system DNA-binding domain-containing protein [Edaphobacter lichenicola]MBB5346181.1 type IV secretory pathway TraG/TraD family ATPase VirD4 [Edaphobacter lichenicola]
MASQWGRKETIIWPPHAPIMSYSALAMALLCTLFFMWEHLNFSMSPLQQSYIMEYVSSQAGSAFNSHGNYRLVYLAGAKVKPRLALPVDLTDGKTTLPSGKTVPIGLSELAQAQGYSWFYRGPSQKLTDGAMHRWLRGAVYNDKGFFEMFRVSMIESGVCLVAMLTFAIPKDLKRFRQMKYGRVLRGPVMLTPADFNRAAKGDGIGFKTTELGKMMRIPERKEAQHFQIMGDTGVGKTQLIMQILRQIRGRGDSAIVYDPACEYIQRFYDEARGDIILNPLDERCPYWGPAQEMATNAEADAIAASLYQPTTDSKDEFFHQTPAQIFAYLLKKGPSPHQLAEWLADGTTLERLVAGTEMSFYIDRKAGPQRAGVLASLGLVAKSFRLLPERDQAKRTWNARTWSQERKGWIFITSRPPERETLRPLHSLWIDLLVMRLLSAPQPGQKQVWFVIDELASLQKLPQLHTAITENRKSKNPLVLGFQGKAQLEVIYGRLAEVMLSQPATKIFMKTAEPKAAEWISEAIGKVEIERLKETKYDGTRSGHNFSLDRQIEPLVMGSEISGLDDRHAYLKLGNNVARFDFDYLDLPTPTPGFLPRKYADGGMGFDPDTLEPRRAAYLNTEVEDDDETAETEPTTDSSSSAPIAHALKQRPIPWPKENEFEPARADEKNRLAPTSTLAAAAEADTTSQAKTVEQIMVANGTPELDGPAFELRP